jgi:hypothetical protein
MLVKAIYRGSNVIETIQDVGFSSKLVNVTFKDKEPSIGDIINVEYNDIIKGEGDNTPYTMRGAI